MCMCVGVSVCVCECVCECVCVSVSKRYVTGVCMVEGGLIVTRRVTVSSKKTWK